MLDGIRRKVANLLQKTSAEVGLGKEYKDVFALEGVPAFNQFYYFGIFIWKYLYKGFYKPWHMIPAGTIADPNATRQMERMNMAKAACHELAGLIWDEQCEVNVSQETDMAETHVLSDFVQKVLKDNRFLTKMQEHIEQSLALGGGALKVYVDGEHDAEGRIIPGTEAVKIGYCMADQFVPTAWDNAKVSEGVFISRQAKDGFYYTRLEWHKWNGKTYVITNELFRSDRKSEDQDILGFRYPLNAIYPLLAQEATVEGLEDSLFAYYRTADANNLDDNSPLGVSIYGNALSTLRALDIAFDSFVREFRLGKKRIIVPASCIRHVPDENGNLLRYFDASDETYEALPTDDPAALKITDNSVSLRVEEHISAINALLNILCLQLGFSAGTFTFDRANGLKTATEVISENAKTYKTIKGNQLQIKDAIERLVHEIVNVASVYDIQFEGKRIADLAADGYEVKVVFDDSVLQDRTVNINEGLTLVGAGLMSKATFLQDKLGLTEDQAEQELKRIKAEEAVTGGLLDLMVNSDAD